MIPFAAIIPAPITRLTALTQDSKVSGFFTMTPSNLMQYKKPTEQNGSNNPIPAEPNGMLIDKRVNSNNRNGMGKVNLKNIFLSIPCRDAQSSSSASEMLNANK